MVPPVDGHEERPDDQADEQRSPIICTVTSTRAVSDTGAMSPKPTVAKTVTTK